MVEIVASVSVVTLFVAVIVALSSQYYDGGFSSEGAVFLVVAIAAFVVVMSIVGYIAKR